MAEVIMSVTINVREAGNVTIVEVTGRVTLGAAGPSIQDTVRELVDSLHTNIIIDLGGITYLDSSGLGQLVASAATATSGGGAIKLLNLTERVYDLMLLLTKLCTVFAIYADEATAVMSFDLATAQS
jgi:anti-sigma B factor antagonist